VPVGRIEAIVKGAVPVFCNMMVRLTGLEEPTIVFGNDKLVAESVATGEATVTTDSTTDVAL